MSATILLSLVLLFVGLAGFALESVERRSKENVADLLESRLQAIRYSIVLWSDDEQLAPDSHRRLDRSREVADARPSVDEWRLGKP